MKLLFAIPQIAVSRVHLETTTASPPSKSVLSASPRSHTGCAAEPLVPTFVRRTPQGMTPARRKTRSIISVALKRVASLLLAARLCTAAYREQLGTSIVRQTSVIALAVWSKTMMAAVSLWAANRLSAPTNLGRDVSHHLADVLCFFWAGAGRWDRVEHIARGSEQHIVFFDRATITISDGR